MEGKPVTQTTKSEPQVRELTVKVLRQVERRLTRISKRRARPSMKAAYREAIKRVRQLTH